MTNKFYDVLKRLVQIGIPAVSSLYFGLAQIWGLPYAEQVVGTLAILATFLGVMLGIFSKQYNNSDNAFDGTVVVMPTPSGGKMYSLELKGDPADIEDMKNVRFKVDNSAIV